MNQIVRIVLVDRLDVLILLLKLLYFVCHHTVKFLVYYCCLSCFWVSLASLFYIAWWKLFSFGLYVWYFWAICVYWERSYFCISALTLGWRHWGRIDFIFLFCNVILILKVLLHEFPSVSYVLSTILYNCHTFLDYFCLLIFFEKNILNTLINDLRRVFRIFWSHKLLQLF